MFFLECCFVLISKVSFCSLLLEFGFLNSLKLLLANPSSITLRKTRNGQGDSFHIKEGDILRTYAKQKVRRFNIKSSAQDVLHMKYFKNQMEKKS